MIHIHWFVITALAFACFSLGFNLGVNVGKGS